MFRFTESFFRVCDLISPFSSSFQFGPFVHFTCTDPKSCPLFQSFDAVTFSENLFFSRPSILHDLVDIAIFLETTDSSSIIFQMGTWDWGSCFICPSFAVSYRDHWREDSMNFSHPKKQVNFGPANNAIFRRPPLDIIVQDHGGKGERRKSQIFLCEKISKYHERRSFFL